MLEIVYGEGSVIILYRRLITKVLIKLSLPLLFACNKSGFLVSGPIICNLEEKVSSRLE